MREILRRLAESTRQSWRQARRKPLFMESKKRAPLTPQERERSIKAAREVIEYAKGLLEGSKEVKIIDPKGSILSIKRGEQLENEENFSEGVEIIISGNDERKGLVSTYLFTESYAFYTNSTFIFMSQSRTYGKRVFWRDEMRREAREEDISELLVRIKNKNSERQKKKS